MSVNPSNFILAPYAGVLIAKPVSICTTQQHQSKVVPISIDWTKYTSFAVSVNLNAGAPGSTPGQVLDKMIGLYIDNSNNTGTVGILFPDTNYLVEVANGTTRFVPIFSQTNILNIYQEDAFAFGSTNILVTNFIYDPFESQGLPQVESLLQGTSTFTPPNQVNQLFVTGVEGDTHLDVFINLTSAGNTLLIPAPPINQGVFIVTNLRISIFNCYISTGPGIGLNLGIRYGTVGQIRISTGCYVNSNTDYVKFTELYTQAQEYIVLDATQAINFLNGVACPGGIALVSLDYMWTLSR